MPKSASWWAVMAVLAVLAFGYGAVYAASPAPGGTPSPEVTSTTTTATSPEASASPTTTISPSAATSPATAPTAPPASAAPASGTSGPLTAAAVLAHLGGDPNAGQALYTANCVQCHGSQLEGGVGFVLSPLQTCPHDLSDTADHMATCPDLSQKFITNVLTKGFPGTAMQPSAFPRVTTDQQRADLAAFIINYNLTHIGEKGSTPQQKMIDNVWLIAILVVVTVGLTYGLSWYNMRWIRKKNAAA